MNANPNAIKSVRLSDAIRREHDAHMAYLDAETPEAFDAWKAASDELAQAQEENSKRGTK